MSLLTIKINPKFIYNLKILLIVCFFIPHGLIFGQFQINGNASQIDCKCYQLTPNLSNQVGSVWNINLIDLNQPFDFSFDVFLGCNNSSQWVGADGIAFGLQALNTNIGAAGGGMGLGGISPSLGVFIDTWQNPSQNDPLNDHISINSNGDYFHNSPNNLAGPYDLGDIEDCAYHTLRVVWTPAITTYSVFFDGNLVLVHVADIVNSIFGGNPLVYWGFTGSTGTQFNEQRFCIDVQDIDIDLSSATIIDEHCNQEDGSISGVTFTGGLSPYTLSWNSNTTNSLDTTNISAGNYTLLISDALGCVDSAGPLTINNIPAPIIDTSLMLLNDEACDQEDGFISGISVSGGVSPYQYFWNNSPSSLDISNLANGSYELVVNDLYGCQDSVTISIDSIGGPIFDNSNLLSYDEDCGQQNGYITGLNVTDGTSPYYYQLNNDTITDLDTSNLANGDYLYYVTDDKGCVDSLLIVIVDGNYHTTDFSFSPTDILAGSSISFEDLSYDTTVYWLWDYGNGSTDTIQNPSFTYDIPGDYTICLTSSNSFNCFDSFCTDIYVIPVDIVIPNIFTPNNDNINDVFEIQGINSQFSLTILNRWGEKIFSQKPYLNNWDGRTRSGLEVPNGTYYYILSNFVVNESSSGSFQISR